jgi:uncharacterized membrane protein
MLIALNGFFCFSKIPILALPIAGISIIFLMGFPINFSGINIIPSLMLLVFACISIFMNVKDYNR